MLVLAGVRHQLCGQLLGIRPSLLEYALGKRKTHTRESLATPTVEVIAQQRQSVPQVPLIPPSHEVEHRGRVKGGAVEQGSAGV